MSLTFADIVNFWLLFGGWRGNLNITLFD